MRRQFRRMLPFALALPQRVRAEERASFCQRTPIRGAKASSRAVKWRRACRKAQVRAASRHCAALAAAGRGRYSVRACALSGSKSGAKSGFQSGSESGSKSAACARGRVSGRGWRCSNLLGQREPEIYGRTTLADINAGLQARAEAAGFAFEAVQSNAEAVLLERAQAAMADHTAFIIINPAAYTHTSVAMRDALAAAH